MCRTTAALGAGIGIALGAFVGCHLNNDLCSPEAYPPDASIDPRCFDDAGADAPDDISDASADAPLATCEGSCVPGPPPGWSFPDLVWIGPADGSFSCPPEAPLNGFDGHADLAAPDLCGQCRCGMPSGSCALPPAVTASAATCAATDASTPRTAFDPPALWDGACTAYDAVPADLACSGVPCVRSLEIAAPLLDEAGCAPAVSASSGGAPGFQTLVRTCQSWPAGRCADSGHVCAPSAPSAPPGLFTCVHHDGDVPCPGPEHSPYTERHLVHADFEDHRTCSPCTCGAPVGGVCTAVISIFEDDTCASPASYVETVDSLAPACHDLTAGAPLGSKSASAPVYTPGACAPSGGDPSGSIDLVGPTTLCCLPPS